VPFRQSNPQSPDRLMKPAKEQQQDCSRVSHSASTMQHLNLHFPFTIRSSNLFPSIRLSNQNCVRFSIPYHPREMPRQCDPHFLSTELDAINNISTLRYVLQPTFYIFLLLTDLQVSGRTISNYVTWKYCACLLHEEGSIIAM